MMARPTPEQIAEFRAAVVRPDGTLTDGQALRNVCRDLFPGRADLCASITASDDLGLPERIRRVAGSPAPPSGEQRQAWALELVERGGIRELLAAAIVDAWVDVVRPAPATEDRPLAPPAEVAETVTAGALEVRPRLAVDAHRGSIVSLTHHSRRRAFLTAGFDGTAQLRDDTTGALQLVLRGHGGPLTAAAFDRSGDRVVTASNDTTACIWDAVTGASIHVLGGHGASVWSATFIADGSLAATGSGDGTARLWSTDSGRAVASFTPTGSPVDLVACSPDGRLLATATSDGTVTVFDIGAERAVHEFAGRGSLWAIRFDGSGRRLAAAGEDGRAELHHLDRGTVTELAGHTDTVWNVVFSADGEWVATVGADGAVRVCATAAADRPDVALATGRGSLCGAAFADRDRVLITAARSGAVDVWDLATGAVVVSDDALRSSLESLCVLDDGGIATSTSTGSLVVRDLVGAARSF